MTLAVAESCTGGLISHYITSQPGASVFFKAGVVSYSDDSKKGLLGVSPDTIRNYGAVSEETAREMAEKVRSLTKSNFSLSTTGNLGPDVLEGKEKGLVYIAASKEGRTVSGMLRLKGSREENKEEVSLAALNLLIELAGEER
jgi:PncC family amidohydrolase